MTAFAIAMVKDEADIIAATVGRMVGQVDELIVADNGSTDGTRDLLADLAGRYPLHLVDDPEPGYYQSAKMTRLAHLAADRGADWVVPFDADEVWYSPFAPRIADLLTDLAPQWLAAEARLFDHVATAVDRNIADPLKRLRFRRREPGPLGKVACRCRADLVIDQGNHGAHYDGGTTRFPDHLVVRHFPYRSAAQFVTKVRNGAAAYRATDLPDDLGAHWRRYGAILDSDGPAAVEDIFRQWFWAPAPYADPTLIYDPCP